MIQDADGKLVSSPSYSPEHGPYTSGNTYEQSLIWQLYEDVITAAEIAVVLNRVRSDEFPNTVREVIFDRKWGVQFTPVANGTVYDEPTQESLLAAKLVLDGARAAGNSLYFIAPELTDNHWTMENRTYVTTIGCHWFYE